MEEMAFLAPGLRPCGSVLHPTQARIKATGPPDSPPETLHAWRSICEAQMMRDLSHSTRRPVPHRWMPDQAGFVSIMETGCWDFVVGWLVKRNGGGGNGEVVWQVCDAYSCDGSNHQRAVGCQRLITQTAGEVWHIPRPLACHRAGSDPQFNEALFTWHLICRLGSDTRALPGIYFSLKVDRFLFDISLNIIISTFLFVSWFLLHSQYKQHK
jgi:hypothetical protein